MHESLTFHARRRARLRGISEAAIDAALDYGQYRALRGADVFTIGWRDVRYWAERGIDLSRWLGVEVVCARCGDVLTVYRNRNPRALRDRPHHDRAA